MKIYSVKWKTKTIIIRKKLNKNIFFYMKQQKIIKRKRKMNLKIINKILRIILKIMMIN